jgi:hypothetical protein
MMLAVMAAPASAANGGNGNHFGRAKNGTNGNHFGQVKNGGGPGGF